MGLSPKSILGKYKTGPRQIGPRTVGYGQLGPRPLHPKVPQSSQKYLKVPKSTSKYPKVPQSTQKNLKVPKSTSKYPKVPQSTHKYLTRPILAGKLVYCHKCLCISLLLSVDVVRKWRESRSFLSLRPSMEFRTYPLQR